MSFVRIDLEAGVSPGIAPAPQTVLMCLLSSEGQRIRPALLATLVLLVGAGTAHGGLAVGVTIFSEHSLAPVDRLRVRLGTAASAYTGAGVVAATGAPR
jgi:hypothetical protein